MAESKAVPHLISNEELGEWLENPVTKSYFRSIHEKLKGLHVELGEGRTVDSENPYLTAQQTAKKVGQIEALKDMCDVKVAMEEELENA